jgi:hypothetical protein
LTRATGPANVPESAVAQDTSVPINVSQREVVLRRRRRLWPVEVVVAVVLAALASAAISLHLGPGTANRVNLGLAIAVVIIGIVVLVRPRPTVTLRPSGLAVGRRQLGWEDISAISDMAGIRCRYVRVQVAPDQRYRRLRALRTSRFMPDKRYARNVAELGRWVTAHADGVEVEHERRGPAWLYPAVVAVLLAIAVSVQDPVHYWLPAAEVSSIPAYCDVDLTNGLTNQSLEVDSPLVPGTRACMRKGDNRVLVVQVASFRRSALVNGAGIAHGLYDRCSFDGYDDTDAAAALGPGPVPADEISASGYEVTGREYGVYLIARKANAIVFVAYSSTTDVGVPAWTCDVVSTGSGYRYVHGALTGANPGDLRTATNVARQILDAMTLGPREVHLGQQSPLRAVDLGQ